MTLVKHMGRLIYKAQDEMYVKFHHGSEIGEK